MQLWVAAIKDSNSQRLLADAFETGRRIRSKRQIQQLLTSQNTALNVETTRKKPEESAATAGTVVKDLRLFGQSSHSRWAITAGVTTLASCDRHQHLERHQPRYTHFWQRKRVKRPGKRAAFRSRW